jgi:hypothetical protein
MFTIHFKNLKIKCSATFMTTYFLVTKWRGRIRIRDYLASLIRIRKKYLRIRKTEINEYVTMPSYTYTKSRPVHNY